MLCTHLDMNFECLTSISVVESKEREDHLKKLIDIADSKVTECNANTPNSTGEAKVSLHIINIYFNRQLGCLAFSLRFWPKIKQFPSNCPASDWSFSFQTAEFC